MKSGIYKITNIINGKIYIGQTCSFKDRKSKHKNRKNNSLISKAIFKYGWDSFRWEILEYCDIDRLCEREQYYFDLLHPFDDNGYNILKTPYENAMRGQGHSEETKRKMKEARAKLNISGENNPFFGKHHTEENKQKRSEDMKERYIGKSNPFYGKKHSQETKEKISQANKGSDQSINYKPIRQIDKDTDEIVKEWESMSAVMRYLNRNPRNSAPVRRVCQGKQKTAYGFKWEYID